MRPLNVEGLLEGPVVTGIVSRQTCSAVFVEHLQSGPPADVELRQSKRLTEAVGIGDDIRIVKCVDDGNRLARACPGDRTERNQIDAVSRQHLRWRNPS